MFSAASPRALTNVMNTETFAREVRTVLMQIKFVNDTTYTQLIMLFTSCEYFTHYERVRRMEAVYSTSSLPL